MALNFQFAVISDLHIALPHTIWDQTHRLHLVETSIPCLESVLQHLSNLDLDFLLLPGDLTQHGEPDNHSWLADRLAQLPYPVYVIPGNHDIPCLESDGRSIGMADFPFYYRRSGYHNTEELYYTCEILPGVRLIGLNSNLFDADGKQLGRLSDRQLVWLEQVLTGSQDQLIIVTIHHNILEHLPDQSRHPLGRRYMLENASTLLQLLRSAGVQLIFTGHLHVQDIVGEQGLYDITTGSLVSYPHAYRVLNFAEDDQGRRTLQIESHRVTSVPEYPDLPQTSREWIGDRSFPFMLKLLSEPPLNLPLLDAKELVPHLRYFWAEVAAGDAVFDFPNFPPTVRQFLESFSATNTSLPIFHDNCVTLKLNF